MTSLFKDIPMFSGGLIQILFSFLDNQAAHQLNVLGATIKCLHQVIK